ncbi:hypothetical protein [Acuticoccus mangrovi]|uniref:Uncharacterized protein n=1 Tax=Acuticoccus mangrovi TaxID=2796142 RepID=A0A934MDZ2_9HYPH|nr:hypothetical protein [Acuticoccus mangrovi]MBJ3776922.1 hypothetical protein [Acuticoccus mangrovi]
MRVLIAFLIVLASLAGPSSAPVAAAPAAATSGEDATHDGSYVLVDEWLTGEDSGIISPIFVVLRVDGERMDFTFLTEDAGNANRCYTDGQCAQAVNALSLTASTAADGTLTVSDVEVTEAPQEMIDDPRVDRPFIIDPVIGFMESARAEWGPLGVAFIGTPTDRIAGRARFLRGDLQAAKAAIAFESRFNVGHHALDRCVMRRAILAEVAPDPTPADRGIAAAAHLAGSIAALDRRVAMLPDGSSAERPLRYTQFAYDRLLRLMTEAAAADPEVSDEALWSVAEEGYAPLRKPLGAGAGADSVWAKLGDERAGFIAFARILAATADLGDTPAASVLCGNGLDTAL